MNNAIDAKIMLCDASVITSISYKGLLVSFSVTMCDYAVVSA